MGACLRRLGQRSRRLLLGSRECRLQGRVHGQGGGGNVGGADAAATTPPGEPLPHGAAASQHTRRCAHLVGLQLCLQLCSLLHAHGGLQRSHGRACECSACDASVGQAHRAACGIGAHSSRSIAGLGLLRHGRQSRNVHAPPLVHTGQAVQHRAKTRADRVTMAPLSHVTGRCQCCHDPNIHRAPRVSPQPAVRLAHPAPKAQRTAAQAV